MNYEREQNMRMQEATESMIRMREPARDDRRRPVVRSLNEHQRLTAAWERQMSCWC